MNMVFFQDYSCQLQNNFMLLFFSLRRRDLNFMRLEEAFEQLKVHELRLQERNSRDEEQALLSKAFNNSKKNQRGSS